MRAMTLPARGAPLRMQERADPIPGDDEIRVVCAGIHMSDIPGFPYNLLWEERQLVSVANLTRQDGLDFLKIAPQAGIRTQTTAFPLAEANDVLARLRAGKILGAAVLKP